MPDIALFVSRGKFPGRRRHLAARFRLLYEIAHRFAEGVGILGRNDPPILSVRDNFPRTVDVGNDGRELHRTGFDDDIGESFPAAGVDERISRSVPGADIGLPAIGEMDVAGCADDLPGRVLDGLSVRLFGPDKEQMCLRSFLFQLQERLHQFVDTLIAVQAPHKDEDEGIVRDGERLPEIRSLAQDLFGLDIVLKVYAPDISVSQGMKGFPGDLEADQIVLDAVSFRYHMGGAGSGESVRRHQQKPFPPLLIREDEPGESVHPDRNPGQPGCHHREQAGLRRDGMHHVGPFSPEDFDQPGQGYQVVERGDLPLHRDGNRPDTFPLPDAFQLGQGRGEGDDFIVRRQIPEQTPAEKIQRQGDGGGPDDFLLLSHGLETVDKCNAKALRGR